jgi:hypothetical protein
MLICFADESTTPPKPTQTGRPSYFVIAGVFIPVAQWHEIARELQALKDRSEYRVRGEIKWRYFGANNDDPKNTVAHLNQSARNDFRKELFQILLKRNSVRAVAGIARVQNCYAQSYINDEHDLYGYTYKAVSERFQYHLQDISRSTGQTHLGMVVSDHRGRQDDERMRREHQKLIHSRAPNTANYANLVEGIFLTQSHTSVGIQFADMVAGATARAYNSDDSWWLDEIKPLIRAKPDGNIDGYGLAKVPNNW